MTEATTKVKAAAKAAHASAFEKAQIPRFDIPKFDLPRMEVPAAFREIAERSVAQARDGYERMKAVAENTTDVLEDTYATATKGATSYTLKAIEAARTNTNAAFDFASELLTAKSLSEAVELTSTHVRERFEALVEQTKQLTAIAQKVAVETSEPLKTGVNKAFKKAA